MHWCTNMCWSLIRTLVCKYLATSETVCFCFNTLSSCYKRTAESDGERILVHQRDLHGFGEHGDLNGACLVFAEAAITLTGDPKMTGKPWRHRERHRGRSVAEENGSLYLLLKPKSKTLVLVTQCIPLYTPMQAFSPRLMHVYMSVCCRLL